MVSKKYRVGSDIVYINIDAINVPNWARKITRDYLKESIQERGVISPIIVGRMKLGKEIQFILIDGYGRLELARELGLQEIPARVIDISKESDALLLSVELEQTKEPWSLEYTLQVIQQLLDFGYTKQKIAEILKIPRNKIYRLLWIDEFPEKIKQGFLEGKIPLRMADKVHEILQKAKPEDLEGYYEDELELKEDPYLALREAIDSVEMDLEWGEYRKKKEEEKKEEEKVEIKEEKAEEEEAKEEIEEEEEKEKEEIEEVEVEEEVGEVKEEGKKIIADLVTIHKISDLLNATRNYIELCSEILEIENLPEEFKQRVSWIKDIVEHNYKYLEEWQLIPEE